MAVETVRVEGLKGVIDTLRSLPPELVSRRGGPVRAALRKAAVLIQEEAQANVRRIVLQPNAGNLPTESIGLLEESIVVARGKAPVGGNGETMLVKIRRNRKYPAEFQDKKGSVTAAKVGRLLEYGSERRSPMPWLRPAFNARKNQALAVFVTEINKGLKRIVNKLKRQNRVRS